MTPRTVKRFIAIITGLSMALSGLMSYPAPTSAQAAGDAYFILSPDSGSYTTGSSFNLEVSENSSVSDNVEGVQVDLTYNPADLQFNSSSLTGTPFTYTGENKGGGGSVTIAEASGSPVSGTQPIAFISFTVIGTSSPNPTTVSIASGSDIQNSNTVSVWNGVDTSASFNLSAPTASNSGSSGASSTTTTKSTTTSTSTTSTSSSSKKTSSPTTTPPTSSTPVIAASNSFSSLSIKVIGSNGKPVIGASVKLSNGTTVGTNTQGVAFFSNLSSGSYRITISGKGIKPISQTLFVGKNQNATRSITVKDASSSIGIYIALVIIVLALAVIYFIFLRKRPGGNRKNTNHAGNRNVFSPGIAKPTSQSSTKIINSNPSTDNTKPPESHLIN